jgi:hypothetical protein
MPAKMETKWRVAVLSVVGARLASAVTSPNHATSQDTRIFHASRNSTAACGEIEVQRNLGKGGTSPFWDWFIFLALGQPFWCFFIFTVGQISFTSQQDVGPQPVGR